MTPLLQNGSLVLASASPRRKYLLEQAGLSFSIQESAVDESAEPWTNDPGKYTSTLALAKAREIAAARPDHWVLGADTIVVLDGDLLGKPRSVDDARRMLSRLSGVTHRVYTGFAVVCRAQNHVYTEVVESRVTFKLLSIDEIEWYVSTDEPYDKAGAYAVQGLGTFFIKTVEGSYTNVVGLPVCEVMTHLLANGVVRFPPLGRL
ncbi:MAG: Maf family protein [Thermodesulfobacteriota bacterium]